MPCRHQQCHSRCTSHPSCCHNQTQQHSIAIQVTNVPSVSTLCCPPTPSSMRSQGTSYEDFCTSETCKDSAFICVEKLPPYCKHGTLNTEDKECKSCQQGNKPQVSENLQENPFAETINSAPKLNEYKDAATSPRISLSISPSSPTQKTYEIETPNDNSSSVRNKESQLESIPQMEIRKESRTLRDYSSQACTSETKIRHLIELNKQNHNSTSEKYNSKESLENKFSAVSFGVKKTHCPAVKKTISDPTISTRPCVSQNKQSSLLENKISESRGTPCSLCSPKKCTKKEATKCQCRYPPAFNQFGCTGKILGNCECDK